MIIGLELTFIPDRKGDKEFPTLAEAKRVARQLNKELAPVNRLLLKCETKFIAKAERFRRAENGKDFKSWIIEVNNGDMPPYHFLWDTPNFVRLVQRVFDVAKSLKLLPRIRRHGIHHPSGGGHLMVGICTGLFSDDLNFLPQLTRFEQNLYVDLANRPYLRWLFSEWFDDRHNSSTTVNLSHYNVGNPFPSNRDVYEWGLSASSVNRRFSMFAKNPYSAYEIRFFDAQTCAKDIVRDVKFVCAWFTYHKAKMAEGLDANFTLTAKEFKALKNIRYAWKVISKFLCDLGLNPNDYRGAFEANYIPRMRQGKMT